MDKTTAFGLPLFFRVVVPGAVAAVLSLPLLVRVLPQLGFRSDDLTVAIVGFALLVGFAIDTHDDEIYKVYEGLRWWPRRLRIWRTSHWESHVARLHARDDKEKIKKKVDAITRGAIASELNDFPETSEGKNEATRPTRLGNILAAYEEYPYRRYGMNATIFWPRLWAVVPKDLREATDREWAVADAWIHSAVSFIVVGLTYILAGALSLIAARFGVTVIFESDDVRAVAIFGGFLLLAASYIPYHWSLPGQRKNGDAFRSTFDMYRNDLKIVLPSAEEWKRWKELGIALLYAPIPEPDSSKEQSDRSDKK